MCWRKQIKAVSSAHTRRDLGSFLSETDEAELNGSHVSHVRGQIYMAIGYTSANKTGRGHGGSFCVFRLHNHKSIYVIPLDESWCVIHSHETINECPVSAPAVILLHDSVYFHTHIFLLILY